MTVQSSDSEFIRKNLANAGPIASAALYNNGRRLVNALAASGAFAAVALQPVGSILPYAGSDSSTPDGWLFCGGQAVSRSDYSDLFDVVGITYGPGDGSTTFNVPDLRGRVIAGKDDMGGTAASRLTSGISGVDGASLGASGGDQRLQGHTHTFSGTTSSTAHRHAIRAEYGTGYYLTSGPPGQYNQLTTSTAYPFRTNYTQNDGAHTHTYSGTTSDHNKDIGSSANVQPTIVTNYIIKSALEFAILALQ